MSNKNHKIRIVRNMVLNFRGRFRGLYGSGAVDRRV